MAIIIPISLILTQPTIAERINSIIVANFPELKHEMQNTPQYDAFNWLTNIHGKREILFPYYISTQMVILGQKK